MFKFQIGELTRTWLLIKFNVYRLKFKDNFKVENHIRINSILLNV